MAEGVQVHVGGDVGFARGQDYRAGCADARLQDRAARRAAAYRAGGVVRASSDDGDAGGYAEFGGCVRADHAGYFGGFDYAGQDAGVQLQRVQHRLGPDAAADVVEQRSGGVRRLGGELAAHAVANVVLGQQQGLQAGVVVGFVLSQP